MKVKTERPWQVDIAFNLLDRTEGPYQFLKWKSLDILTTEKTSWFPIECVHKMLAEQDSLGLRNTRVFFKKNTELHCSRLILKNSILDCLPSMRLPRLSDLTLKHSPFPNNQFTAE